MTAKLPPDAKHHIHPGLVTLAVPLTSLNPDPRNARSHDDRNLEAVVGSYRDHGQRKPIVVQLRADNGTPMVIRAGNASAEAAKKLGWTHIAAVVVDEPDKEAKRYALRDNRTADLAEWHLPNLGAELRDLKGAGVDVSDLGWEPFEFQPLMEAEWKPPDNDGTTFDTPGKFHNIRFADGEFEALQARLGSKPTAAAIMAALGANKE